MPSNKKQIYRGSWDESLGSLVSFLMSCLDLRVGEKNKKQATRLIDKSPVLKYNNV